MATLHIEHSVHNYEDWKRTFDSDPADRKGSGVRRYRVSRSAPDGNLVRIELDFDDLASAEAMHAKLKQVWAGPAADVVNNPVAAVFEDVETVEL